jgi:acyl-CoA thioesterase YciA
MAEDTGPGDRQPVIQTITMPADANANGDIFGGWVLSQMDIAGGVAAGRVAKGRCATVAVEAMTFHRPISVGDLVSLYADVTRVGTTSIAVHIDTYVTRRDESQPIKVTDGTFIYVAIDERGGKRPVPR